MIAVEKFFCQSARSGRALTGGLGNYFRWSLRTEGYQGSIVVDKSVVAGGGRERSGRGGFACGDVLGIRRGRIAFACTLLAGIRLTGARCLALRGRELDFSTANKFVDCRLIVVRFKRPAGEIGDLLENIPVAIDAIGDTTITRKRVVARTKQALLEVTQKQCSESVAHWILRSEGSMSSFVVDLVNDTVFARGQIYSQCEVEFRSDTHVE